MYQVCFGEAEIPITTNEERAIAGHAIAPQALPLGSIEAFLRGEVECPVSNPVGYSVSKVGGDSTYPVLLEVMTFDDAEKKRALALAQAKAERDRIARGAYKFAVPGILAWMAALVGVCLAKAESGRRNSSPARPR